MSGNQKQAAGGGPQNQRYSAQIYQGVPQQRTDGFHVQTSYVPQQQPNQQGNQGQSLRGIAPTGPPNQSSTPPTNDLKVQSVAPQQSMNHMFPVQQQQQVRGTQGAYYRTTTGPQNPTPRMPNQHRGHQMYQQPFMSVPMTPQLYATLPQYYNSQRQQYVQQPSHVVYGQQTIPSQFAQYQGPTQATPLPYSYFQLRQGGHQPQTTAVPPNAAQALPPMPIQQNPPQTHNTFPRPQTQRRPKAIPIIDPDTGADRLSEIYEQNSSHPPSGESSARQTPQPPPPNNKEVQAIFAKQVVQAINNDTNDIVEDSKLPIVPPVHGEDLMYHPYDHPPPPANLERYEHIAQSSTLKAQAKEFVLNSPNTAKETPIVSANCDSVEVTLPNKPIKDRESPAKGRKQREQQVSREHKDSVKDAPIRENVSDKESSVKIEHVNKPKETVVNVASNVTPATTGVAVTVTSKDNKEVVHEKKTQKKDSKTEIKVPNEVVENVAVAVSQPAQPAQELSSTAKSKNASRTKDVQKQQPQQPQQAPPAPVANSKAALAAVPPPQPSKPSSKTSKKSDLNLKGANKEGTDMDAFSDAAQLDAANANINENSEINANSLIVANNTNSVEIAPTNINDANTINHNNDVSTIKIETKPLPKKIDVTDIVKETPKPIKSFPVAVTSQDETDRSATTNDILVQAKNEVNAKGGLENNAPALIETKPDLPYKEGQWSPDNQDGKKVYGKDFLISLRNQPASKKKPDNLPEWIVSDERRLSDGRYSMSGRATDFTTPPFPNYGGKSSSQRGPPPKRNSQSGKLGGGGGKGKSSIKLSISVREDVKLHEVENAWKPGRMKKGADVDEDDVKTAELYKKVRGVLNKLTPQKFQTLVGQVRSLNIDTASRLQGVIDLVFEKAVDEPNFSVAYALMCRELALMQAPATNNPDDASNVVNFRKLLLTRCQYAFEKQSIDESIRNEKVKEINDSADPEKKKELRFELEEYDRKLRMKSVGNIRFIGELFKQRMLTVTIMLRCLQNLLANQDEESLECLCKLLTTIGSELESKKIDLDPIFIVMKEIVDKKRGKVSSRVRFMLQDVIDLRKGRWVPRRQDSNPKTIDQIQKEAETEQLNIQAMNSVPITPRKDDRGMNAGPNSDRKRNKGPNVSDDGWHVTQTRNRQQFTIQSDKLKYKPPLQDEPLGSKHTFVSWSKGSNIKTEPSVVTNSGNIFTALQHIDTEKRPSGSRSSSKDPYSSKGPSLERGNYKQSYDVRGSRSGSQHRSNERDFMPPSQKPTPATPAPAPVAAPSAPKPAAAAPPTLAYNLNEDQLERHVKNSLDEYINDSQTVEEYALDIQAYVPPHYFSRVVSDGYLHVLEKFAAARLKTGGLFAKLIKSGVLPIDDYCTGLEELLVQADDLTIDIPKFWDYLGEILVHLICDEALLLNRLLQSCELIIQQGHGTKLLPPLFKLVIKEKGPNFLSNLWNSSGVTLDKFIEQSQVDQFVKDNKFEFLCGGDAAAGQSQVTFEQTHQKLIEFFNQKSTFDDIVNWITANVGERVTENKFIRILATAIFENSMSRQILVVENLQGHYKLLQKYVDTNSKYELQCLFALQALIHKMEHPKGVLLTICDRVYEDAIISQDSFLAWETSDDPAEQEGKGVALKQLTSFFTQLKENEDYGSSSDEN